MPEFPNGGLIGKAVHFVRSIRQMQVRLYAANAGYFVVLSVFPALVLILGLLRYTPLQVDALTSVLEGVIPSALMPTAEKLIISTYANTSGLVISISALISLWSASKGVYGILTGLNAIYDVSEERGFFYTRGISIVFTFQLFIVLFLTLGLHVFGTSILAMIPPSATSFLNFLSGIIDFRFILLLILQTALFTAIYMIFPNRNNTLRDSLPGAVLASLGWLIFSDLYSIYVENFASLSNIYGSVYAIALSMLWLYCCLSIMFYGGAFNRYLMERKGQ